MGELNLTWESELCRTLKRALDELSYGSIEKAHVDETPARYVQSLKEYFSGCSLNPASILAKRFPNKKYDEMVYVNDIRFVSFCAHHLIPFFGKVHFAYVPGKEIVGLSKIPRMIEMFAKRPQVQEKLTVEIADCFAQTLKPKGCGVVIEAHHMCMMIRGVKKETTYSRTTALRGCFLRAKVRAEFLDGIRKTSNKIWP